MVDDLYVPCPRCRGTRLVFAVTRPGNGFTPSSGEYFACPLCHQTGEADAQAAAAYLEEQRERAAWDA